MKVTNNPNKINVFNLEKELEIEDKFKQYFKTQDKIYVDLKHIYSNPFQPRAVFDEVKLQELAASIKKIGLITPVLLRKINDERYEILAGERRVKACEIAGLKKIPAIVGMFDDQQMTELAIVENIQREQLNSMEEAIAFKNLSELTGMTNDQIASKIGKSRSYVANTMRLLTLPKTIQQYVINGVLSMGHVKPLIGLKEKDALKLANQAIEQGLSVRQVENLSNLLKGRKEKNKVKEKNPYFDYVTAIMNKKLGARVRIKDGIIKIYFKDQDDLKSIVDKLN